MTKAKLIFLGGIHGTGKGVFGNCLESALKITCLSASELIKWSTISSNRSNKAVDNIPETQDLLISALSKYRESNESYLLDGHYCLFNSNHEPTEIELSVFQQINPDVLLLKTENPSIIKERLQIRDKRNYSIELIRSLAQAEACNAQKIASAMHIPLFEVSTSNQATIINQLNQFL